MVIHHPDDLLGEDLVYLVMQITDNSSDPNDNVVLMFDNSHDQMQPTATSYAASDDRGIRLYRDGRKERIFGSAFTPGVGPAGALPGTQCIQGGGLNGTGGTGWSLEVVLRPSDLGVNNFNSLVGASVIVRNTATNPSFPGVWPSTAMADPNTWATLAMRQPVDFILLVDQSGSMAGAHKWPSAKQAVDNFALVLSRTKDVELDAKFPLITTPVTVGSGDRLGLANFTSAFPAPPPQPGWSSEVTSLATIPANPGSFSGGLPVSPGGGTPIAGGLNRTFDMFGGPVAGSPRTRVVMLLSDGMHNTPNSSIDLTPPSADLNYLPTTCGDNSLVRVSTVAVGTDATVDVMKLSDLKNCYRLSGTDPGASSFPTYNTVDPVGGLSEAALTAKLTRFFVETIEPHFQWNTITTTGADFNINAGDRRLLLFAFWADKSDAVNLSITRPNGNAVTGSSSTSLGYSWLLLNTPANGTYTNFNAPGAVAKFVMVDLGVRADFAVDNRRHGTGGTILLRARLREGGGPVLGADVRTDIARPGEGFGTYASTHTLNSCVASPPQLPAPIRGEGRTATRINTAGLPPDTTGDAKPPAFALVAALFQKCGKTDFSRLAESGRQLFDDGSHGDATPGDGIYTLAMDNTQFEGSYVFQFRATGLTSDGQPFSRIHETAAYVGVEVDPGSSPVGSRVLQVAGNLVTQEFWVLPRSRQLEYFGPGHGDKVSFGLSGNGTLVGPVIDYNNGYYGQVVRYDRSQRPPVVTPVVNGKPLTPIPAVPRPWELVAPFAGATFFDNALGLDDGFVVGLRIGRRVSGSLWLEAEGGVTFIEAAGNSGHVIQLLGNVRYDLTTGQWVPYVTAGAGYALFRGFASSDEAFLVQGGAGATLNLSPRFGLRADTRLLRFGSVFGAGSSTNVQATGGVVWRF